MFQRRKPKLDQAAISRSLGSTMITTEGPQHFGRLGLLPLVAAGKGMVCETCDKRERLEPTRITDTESRNLCWDCRDELREHGQDSIGVDDEFPEPADIGED